MAIASTNACVRSMSPSALNRMSRCSSASGTVLNEVMTNVVLMTTTTSGNCGAWKKRPNGSARKQDASQPTRPNNTAIPWS